MNLYLIITLIVIFLLTFFATIALLLNIKNCRRLLPKFRLRNSIRLNKSFRQLLSKSDRRTRKGFKNNTNFFVHVNTSNIAVVEKETNKELNVELYKVENINYNQYLSNQSYILELHEIDDNHIYKELGKFCSKISSLTGKVPTLVYSFESKKIKNEEAFLKEIKSLRSIIIQLTKVYKNIPSLVLSIADIEDHPSYNTFIECVANHNIPLVSPLFKPDNLDQEIDTYLKKLNLVANNLLFKKQPQEFLRFCYFINDNYAQFKQLLKKQNYLDSNKAIYGISLYLNNTKANINQSLFQSSFKSQKYKAKTIKKVLCSSTGVILTVLGTIFISNTFSYKALVHEYKQDLFNIPDQSKYIKQTISLSKDYIDKIGSQLIGKAIYPKKAIAHGIYINEGVKIQNQILAILEQNHQSENNINRTFVFLTLIAPHHLDLQKLIIANLNLWSVTTGIPKETIVRYIKAPVPTINPNISNIEIGELSYKSLLIKSHTYNMIKTYITENSNINLKTLNIFIDKINLPMAKQQVISRFMKRVFPEIKDSLSQYNINFLEKLYQNIQTVEASDEIKEIKDLIPSEKDTRVDNLQTALDLLTNTNQKLDQDLTNNKTKSMWRNAILQATYNDILNNLVLSKARLIDEDTTKQSIVNIGDNGGYYGDISIMYSKIGIKEAVLPVVNSYKKISKLLGSHDIKTSALDNYYNYALQNYIQDYKKSYIELIASYKNSIDPDDLVSSLLLISSTSSQFNNMLRALADNTVFDKKILKEIPKLSLINSYFEDVNKMISNPSDMDKYDQIIREIANQIRDTDDEHQAINKITLNLFTKTKDSYYYKVESLLKKNNISKENSIIFIVPLQNIMKFGKPYLIKYKYKLWYRDIISLIEKYQEYFPFSKQSTKIIPPEELTKVFGPKGIFWEKVRKDMYGIFEYKNGQWQSRIPNFFGNNTQNMTNTLNKIKKLSDTLWDKSGKPKPLDITLHIMPIPNNLLTNNTFVKMTILSIGHEKVVGISAEQKPITLKYKWFEQQTSSVGYIDNHEQISSIETHSSYWSFINLLDEASKNGDIYAWNQNNITIKFKVTFDNIVNALNN